ncbi:cytokinin dehydrogenase 4-like [Salvia miltiorrhiza]|uniref:cytokinin dehydrogenase 4-like n=1 Tax=Salvia miltiorrhiza TaxID=226208 RepID=UPI0025ABFBDC|nr:cytokinin dehydrogenase 4-like [Salvia miltiorrhiza]
MSCSISTLSILLSILIIIHSIRSAANPSAPNIRNDSDSLRKGSSDYGNIVHEIPTGVLYPSTEKDIIDLIRSRSPLTVAARGRGHSVRGQAMAGGGVVVDMTALGGKGGRIQISKSSSGMYADVGGEQLWIDVLRAAVAEGVAPVSWTDYVYLSVGGTLSNAGISGQAFLHGPQIANVVELDVITGKGEFMSCSRTRNPELFYGVLGGLGQFGIITRARIILDKAPTRVKWAKLLYSNFTTFSRDQEYLISNNCSNYVEGFLITNENAANEWTSSSPSRQDDVAALLKKQGILYAIELVKYYDNQTAATIDEEFETLLKELKYMSGYNMTTDASFVDFIARVGNLDNETPPLQSHPWLNLFIPKSGIFDFNAGVLAGMLPKLNHTSGIFIFYPLNRNKWDERMSAVVPDEEVFYALSLLHSTPQDDYHYIDEFNQGILEFCRRKGIEVKQYLPNIKSKQEWIHQFGSKWPTIQKRKAMFDPNTILSPGQRIFNSA